MDRKITACLLYAVLLAAGMLLSDAESRFLLAAEDEAAAGLPKGATEVQTLTRQMRAAMLAMKQVEYVNEFGIRGTMQKPIFDFDRYLEGGDLHQHRMALFPLLQDEKQTVREQAARTAHQWITAAEIDKESLLQLLNSDYPEAADVGLEFAFEGGIESRIVVQLTSPEGQQGDRASIRFVATDALGDYAFAGDELAQNALQKLVQDQDPNIAARAISVIRSLESAGRFAEAELRTAMQDDRSYAIAVSSHFASTKPIQLLAVESLRSIRFVDEKTATKLRGLFLATKTQPPEEQNDELRLATAMALAGSGDFAHVRMELVRQLGYCEQRFHKNEVDDDVSLPHRIPMAIDGLLDSAERAILDWELGESVCRRCISNRRWRESDMNWAAVGNYPNAAVVFRKEINFALKELRFKYDDAPYFYSDTDAVLAFIIRLLGNDGLTTDEAQEILQTIGKQEYGINSDVEAALAESLHYSPHYSGGAVTHSQLALLMHAMVKTYPEFRANYQGIASMLRPKCEDAAKRIVNRLLTD